MASSEVFRPSNGDLLVRDQVSHSADIPADHFKKETLGRRPMTQGGYRFGQLSHNSFFTRHNPHPGRVRHLKGLLDVPICSVNDDGYFANPRYSLNFPPSQFNNNKLKGWKGQIPVSAINVNSQLHPINTITGLQYFTGLNSYPYREKAIPKVGLVPVTEAWRDELREFTRCLGLLEEEGQAESYQQQQQHVPVKPMMDDDQRPKTTTMYSSETGRLIPPPSRAMSRGASRRGRADQKFMGGNMQHIAADPDLENVVLTMLCQILQTEDINAVHAWLCSAGEREKGHVTNLLKSAMNGREEYYKQYPAEYVADEGKNKLPPIGSGSRPGTSAGEINRLVIEEEGCDHGKWQKSRKPTEGTVPENDAGRTVVDDADMQVNPPINAVFKPLPPVRRTVTPLQQQARCPSPPKFEKPSSPEPRLKYTKSPSKEKREGMWNQNDSINTF